MTVIFAGLILALVALVSLLLLIAAAASRHQKASATKFDVVGRLASVEKEICRFAKTKHGKVPVAHVEEEEHERCEVPLIGGISTHCSATPRQLRSHPSS